jgi:hypothetical protein
MRGEEMCGEDVSVLWRRFIVLWWKGISVFLLLLLLLLLQPYGGYFVCAPRPREACPCDVD